MKHSENLIKGLYVYIFQGPTFRCDHCHKSYRYKRNWMKHQDLCAKKKKLKCKICKRLFHTDEQRIHHEKVDHATKNYKCRNCNGSFENRRELYIHRSLQHGGGESLRDWVGGRAPWEAENGETSDPELKRVIEVNRRLILGDHRVGEVSTTYNFPTNNLDNRPREFESHLNEIFRKEDETFKINVAFGSVFRHVETGDYRYFVAYENGNAFPEPFCGE